MIIDPHSHGAQGDGVADDTSAIQAAIDICRDEDIVQLHHGATYKINPNVGIRMGSFKTLEMTDAVMTQGGTNQPATRARMIYTVPGSNNIKIFGGALIGSRLPHAGLQWGKGIWVDSSMTVEIEGVEISDQYFDGIGIGGNTPSSFVSIRDCHITNCRRNALTMTNAEHVRVSRTSLMNSNGQEPAAGCDIEANKDERVHDVILQDCIFFENSRTGLHIHKGHGLPPSDIWVQKCTFQNNGLIPNAVPAQYNFIGNACNGLRFVDNIIKSNTPGQRGAVFGEGTDRFVCFGNDINVGPAGYALVFAGVHSPKVFENNLRGGNLVILPNAGLQGVFGKSIIEDE